MTPRDPHKPDPETPDDWGDFERRLAAWRPADPPSPDRDALIFEAGRQAGASASRSYWITLGLGLALGLMMVMLHRSSRARDEAAALRGRYALEAGRSRDLQRQINELKRVEDQPEVQFDQEVVDVSARDELSPYSYLRLMRRFVQGDEGIDDPPPIPDGDPSAMAGDPPDPPDPPERPIRVGDIRRLRGVDL